MIQNNIKLELLAEMHKETVKEFPHFDKRHFFFCLVCLKIATDFNMDKNDESFSDLLAQNYIQLKAKCPFGGRIGVGNSRLDRFLKWSKVLRLHAAFHDAHGFMKTEYNVGPGYIYCPFIKLPINCCFLGHVTGILYCYWLKFFNSKFYRNLSI